MKRYISAFLVVFSLSTAPLAAFAAGESSTEKDTRFFLANTKTFWKNSLGARHSFEDGFTADLSDFELRFAKLAGLKPVPVKRLTILPAEVAVVPAIEVQLPTAPVPWGVSLLVDGASTGGASVSVAVLDTGVDVTHPDLSRRITSCQDFTGFDPIIADGTCTDENGHGTHVAGIIAADGGRDGNGILGLAPRALVKAYKVCDAKGSCWADDLAIAIRTAADSGAQIINLSLGSDGYSSLVADAVTYAVSKGSLVIAAAGNDGPYPGSIDYPAALNDVIAVGALDGERKIADWSSRGTNADTELNVGNEGDIEFAAPGVNVESTFPGGGYAILSGTSMAAPHVAGLAALYWDFTAEHPAAAARAALHASAHDVSPVGEDEGSGWGLPIFLR